jgi:hypothetical protein
MRRRRPTALFIAAALACVAGCGGSQAGETSAETAAQTAPPAPGTIEALWKAPGEDVGLIQGTRDYAPGKLRVSFLVVRGNGAVVERPTARVWLARGLKQKPFAEATARLEPIGVPGGSTAEVGSIYVTELEVAEPGTYWLLAEPDGAEQPIQGLGNLVVAEEFSAPVVGEQAPASESPTLASTGGDFEALTTSEEPVRALYEQSVAELLAAGKPFVVAFATPAFCESRACGPTVEVVDAVRQRVGGSALGWHHVEIYADNDPNKGVNRWVEEWNLPSEPWVFVVGADGKVAARFEGHVSVEELEAAVRRVA